MTSQHLTLCHQDIYSISPKKYAHGFCFAVLCCGYTLTDFPISIRLTSLALWQSNDCPSASKATLMNMDKYFMWIHYERLHNHIKAKHNKTVCIFLGIYCILPVQVRHATMSLSTGHFDAIYHCVLNAALQYILCILRTSDHNYDNDNASVQGTISKCLYDIAHNASSSQGVDEVKL